MAKPVHRLPEVRPLHQFFGGKRVKHVCLLDDSRQTRKAFLMENYAIV
jgi:hypothetical protein